MAIFSCYVRLFGCLIITLASSSLYASSAGGFAYETSVDKLNKSINVIGQKNGNIYKTAVRPTPSILRSAISSRALRGGAVGALLFAATYYGMTYNQDDGTFTKKAENSQWEWCYISVCSASPSVVGTEVLNALNKSWSGTFLYSNLIYSISASGMLNLYFDRKDLASGSVREKSLERSIGGKPNTQPTTPEIIQPEVFAEALLNDAFAVEGSGYFPSLEQRTKATDALLDLYNTADSTATQTDETVKQIESSLINTAPQTKDGSIKDATGAVTGVLPDFCSWATPICDVIYDDTVYPENTPPPKEVGNYQISDLDQLSISFNASCPPDYSQKISLGITAFDLKFSYEPLCQFASSIKYFVIASGFIAASLILIGYSKS